MNAHSEIRLRCCGGEAAPAAVLDGWNRYLAFDEPVRLALWELLGPALQDPNDPEADERGHAFCGRHGVDAADVVAALQACAFLFTRSASLDLAPEAFQQDLALISAENAAGAGALAARYGEAKPELRRTILRRTLADHGKLLVGLEWRVDTVTASHRGASINTPVILLTLRYEEGDRLDRITLQLTHETMVELKAFCDRATS